MADFIIRFLKKVGFFKRRNKTEWYASPMAGSRARETWGEWDGYKNVRFENVHNRWEPILSISKSQRFLDATSDFSITIVRKMLLPFVCFVCLFVLPAVCLQCQWLRAFLLPLHTTPQVDSENPGVISWFSRRWGYKGKNRGKKEHRKPDFDY